MNQDKFFTKCTTPRHKTLIGGSSFSGKSSMVLDMVVKFLHQNYRKDLDTKAINELHSILNDQIPVLILTEEPRYNLLLRLSQNCLPDPELSDEEKAERLSNLCGINNPPFEVSEDYLIATENFISRHQVKLVVVDGYFPGLTPETIVTWSRIYNLALVQTIQNTRTTPGYSMGKKFIGPMSHLTTSDLAVMLAEPVKTKQDHLKFEVTVLKDRQGLISDKEFIYECQYQPY